MLTQRKRLMDVQAVRKLVHAIKSMDRYMGRITSSKTMPENRRVAIAELKVELGNATKEQVERLEGEEKSIYEQARRIAFG